MPIPLYLAMTGAEFQNCSSLPPKIGYMACHFSPYGVGLSNCPRQLPPGSLLVLNDRTPVCGHDPRAVAAQMADMAAQMDCAGILLDMQIPNEGQTANIVEAICNTVPCPVGVSRHYWDTTLGCAVFLEPPPLHIPLSQYLSPWQGQQIWMEAAVESADYCITERGCRMQPAAITGDLPHRDQDTFCRYRITITEDAIRFSLQRNTEDLHAMMAAAEGISLFVGLYQQLK